MEEQKQQLKQISSIRKKHPPAVPFLWEERPGTPKHHWKSNTTAAIPPPNLIASVPFEWEELPGKPLSCFSHPPPPPSYSELDTIPLLLEDRGNDIYYELPSQTEEYSSTFCSDNPTVDWNSTPSSPESESAAGGASLVGVPFLERLFPLLSSHQGGLHRQNAGTSINNIAITKAQEEEEEKADGECKPCVAVRRAPHTLGELIMMSRRISRKRKSAAIQIQKQGISMEMIEKSTTDICMGGSCMFGIIDNWNSISNWKKKTHFHQLKFM